MWLPERQEASQTLRDASPRQGRSLLAKFPFSLLVLLREEFRF